MKALSLSELELELGDILVCDSAESYMFTHGCEYEVEQAEDGKLGVNTDCGYLATTSASLFINITNAHSASELSSGKLNEWPIHELKRVPVNLGTLIPTGAVRCVQSYVSKQAHTRIISEQPSQPRLVDTRR